MQLLKNLDTFLENSLELYSPVTHCKVFLKGRKFWVITNQSLDHRGLDQPEGRQPFSNILLNRRRKIRSKYICVYRPVCIVPNDAFQIASIASRSNCNGTIRNKKVDYMHTQGLSCQHLINARMFLL